MFCEIAAGRIPATVLHEDADVIAFLDIAGAHRPHQPAASGTIISLAEYAS